MPAIDHTVPSRFVSKRIGNKKIRQSWDHIRRAYLLFPFLLGILFLCATTSAEIKGSESASPDSQRQQNPEVGQGNFKISVNVNLVTTDVRVIGKSLSKLEAKDFIVYDNKVSQELTFFSYDQLPIAVAVLVDKSESVRRYFPLLQIAALLSLKNLKPEDQVALFSFSDSCRKLNDLTEDRLLIAQKVSKIKAGGGTYLFQALSKTARFLHKEAPDRRRAIILISDNCSSAVEKDVRNALEDVLEASATLYSIRTPLSSYYTPRGPRDSCTPPNNKVKEIVERTGGEFFEVDSSVSLQTALEKAITNIRYQYTIGFTPSYPGERGSYHTLDVKLSSEDLYPGCRIVTRKGYKAGIHPPAPPKDSARPVSKAPVKNVDELLIQRSIVTAGTTELDLPDIPFTVETVQLEDLNDQPQLEVNIKIDPSGIGFKRTGDLHTCTLHITVFYADKTGKILGYDWKTVKDDLNEINLNRVMKEGILYQTRVPIKAEKRILKIVVYNEESNKIGSKLVTLPQ
jgi:VWFA-related protein